MSQLSTKHNSNEYTVSEISHSLKQTVEDAYGYVRVRGEISGLKRAPSGHVYLNLKDNQAVLAGVCWRGVFESLRFEVDDGLEVIASGRITTYPGQSKYQLVIEKIEPSGVGALMALLEKRKQQLSAEGLFDTARKKDLPFFPRCIGVITSPTGAVIQDILHRIEARFPTHVKLWPVLVQGELAAGQIATAIDGFNALTGLERPDVLIVARGGGSLEDLWAFNEEIVVRAVARSLIPLVSAVGHETDTTLIDYAADKRAPTPTAAAEMVTPVRSELLKIIFDFKQRLWAGWERNLNDKHEWIKGLSRGLFSPQRLLEEKIQYLDQVIGRKLIALPALMHVKQQQLAVQVARMRSPKEIVPMLELQLQHLGDQQKKIYIRLVEQGEKRLELATKLLESYQYKRILERGFVLIKQNNKLISSSRKLKKDMQVVLEMHDGEREAKII